MSDRPTLTDADLRRLLAACAMFPSGDADGPAELTLGEAVSVLNEVLTLRARVDELRAMVREAAGEGYALGVYSHFTGGMDTVYAASSARADEIADRLLGVPDAD